MCVSYSKTAPRLFFLAKGVDKPKADCWIIYLYFKHTEPSRYGCGVWGRPSLSISSINIGTFAASTMTALRSVSWGFFCVKVGSTKRSDRPAFLFEEWLLRAGPRRLCSPSKKRKNLAGGPIAERSWEEPQGWKETDTAYLIRW